MSDRRGAAAGGRGDRARPAPPLRRSRAALVLVGLSLVAAVVGPVAAGAAVAFEGVASVGIVVGPPLACVVAAGALERGTSGVLGSAGVGVCGLALLGWATLLFLGVGFGLFPAALLLLAAAAVSADHRLRAGRPRTARAGSAGP